MKVAFKLSRTEKEVLDFSPDEFARWVAFFNLSDEREKDAIKKQQRQGRRPPQRPGGNRRRR